VINIETNSRSRMEHSVLYFFFLYYNLWEGDVLTYTYSYQYTNRA